MTADHRASEFLEKCHGLPLHPGDRVAIEGIERNIRGTSKAEAMLFEMDFKRPIRNRELAS
jgi:hypothetical protein